MTTKLNQTNGMVNKMESDYKTKFQYFRIPDIYELPDKGKPEVYHLSLYERGNGFIDENATTSRTVPPTSKGGHVTCRILDNNGDLIAYGNANCSYADNFCYRIGREIALGRAKKQLERETK